MSLLDRGPDTITVYPAGATLPDGTRGPAGAPITVSCRVQPSSTANDGDDGYADMTTYRVIARSLPAGPWDRVTWDGRDWTVVGQPQKWRGSARVTHHTAVIQRR